jgi:hypothetical protein
MRRKCSMSRPIRQRDALESGTSADLLGRVHLLAEVFGLDHMGGDEEIQGVAKPMDVAKSILFRTVSALVINHIRWGRRNYGCRDVGDSCGKLLHCRRLD